MTSYMCMFVSLLEILSELVSSKRLRGSLTGGKADKAQYIPDNFLTAQNQWVDAFYQQNGYLGDFPYTDRCSKSAGCVYTNLDMCTFVIHIYRIRPN